MHLPGIRDEGQRPLITLLGLLKVALQIAQVAHDGPCIGVLGRGRGIGRNAQDYRRLWEGVPVFTCYGNIKSCLLSPISFT